MPEEKWVLVRGESEGHPYFMMVNDGLKDFTDKDEYNYCLVVNIELSNVKEHKLPTNDEAEVLNEIEDVILSGLGEYTETAFVGRETYFGVRELLIYFQEIGNLKVVVDELHRKANQYRTTGFEVHHDPSWKNAKRYFGS